MAVDTERIMKAGLELAGWKKMPADSAVHVRGKNIRKVLIAIDVGTAELMLARQLGCDAVIAHHPIGIAHVNFYKVFDRHVDYGELTKMREDRLAGNLVVMGHLAGDSVGLNGLAERLEGLGVETVRVGILPGK